MAKLYEFTITVTGWGENPEDAWENVKENFDIVYEGIPNSDNIDLIDSDEE
jgi:hypothetical protein